MSLVLRDAAELERLVAQAEGYLRAAKSTNTRRSYQSDLRDFRRFCASIGHEWLPAQPATVALYLADLAQRCRPTTVGRRSSAIRWAHVEHGVPSPTTDPGIAKLLDGIRRTHGMLPAKKKPLTVDALRAIVIGLGRDARAVRDRAVLLVGFAGAFRRSELVSIDVADVTRRDGGVLLQVRSSKTDQEGTGRPVPVPFADDESLCPVRALMAWIETAGIDDGPVFRAVTKHGTIRQGRLSANSVADIVKRHVGLLGYDVRDFAGHSLRSGLITAAAEAGVPEWRIATASGHESSDVLRDYIQPSCLLDDAPARALL